MVKIDVDTNQGSLNREIEPFFTQSHEVFITDAFNQLSQEFTSHGFSERFLDLRKSYSEKLIAYWRKKIGLFEMPDLTENESAEKELVTESEKLRLLASLKTSNIGDPDQPSIYIFSETDTEWAEARFKTTNTLVFGQWITENRITSIIRPDPLSDPTHSYTAEFDRNGLLSRFSYKQTVSDEAGTLFGAQTSVLECEPRYFPRIAWANPEH